MLEAITPLIQDYIVDFASNNNFFFIKGVQGDGYGVRYARLSLSNNGQPYIINKDTVRAIIIGTKPDTKEVCNECEIVDSSTIKFELTQQMLAVSGKGDYSIVIMSTSTNQMLTSFPFYIFSNKTSFDVDYVTSSNEFTLLISKINQVDALSDDVKLVISNAELVIADCEEKTSLCIAATDAATLATNEIRALGLSIERAENLRAQTENLRVQAEDLRKTNTATAISNANNATRDAINATENANQKITELQDKLDEYNSLNVVTSIQSANTATIEAQKRIDEYDSLNLITVTQNTITATDQANLATSKANTAASNANTATNEAILAAQDARKAIEEIQEAVGIDDTIEGTTTTWSSLHIHEVIGQDINTAIAEISGITPDEVDGLFQTMFTE